MANTKAIRKQIASITSTRKITSAMEMVAASKMRRAQEHMEHARPYAETIWDVVTHLVEANPEYRPPYMREFPEDEIRKVGFLVVSSEKGLCGGLNINLFKSVVQRMHEEEKNGREVEVFTIGAKGVGYFRSLGVNVRAAALSESGERASPEELFGAVRLLFDGVAEGRLQRVYLCYNQFFNTMTQQPQVVQLLPPLPAHPEEVAQALRWDYIYEPDPRTLLDQIIHLYVESVVHRAVVENFACEQAAKMVAMKSATDNAGDLIDELQLVYNNARQAAITQELAEIIGGAAAV